VILISFINQTAGNDALETSKIWKRIERNGLNDGILRVLWGSCLGHMFDGCGRVQFQKQNFWILRPVHPTKMH